ncbi:uncharacterized protein C8A04DRAFT_34948 [Dichotomopilus funicola]|uniref:Cyclic nucleotide-binding domain-containing protein n=1 Tax=Dichotomopilus funicola TaxID=1934379 RepID=A0AAN6V816_9PEZI|nr:hypothetical protein C8A04DRAFT_34948 [Dichotomopilus funicola]
MSRALDKATAALLKKGDPQAAFQAISEALIPPYDSLLEIEILGGGPPFGEGQYLLQDGRAVGISKLGLVQAFMLAREQLSSHLNKTNPRTPDELFLATSVILLFDPEYLTAANTRKRLIQAELSSSSPSPSHARTRLTKELRFIDSLLTSRLHRHTKSPVLWSHRRWLVDFSASSLEIPVDVISTLKDVVFVAGERHPRNYYAWCHARFLTTRALQQQQPQSRFSLPEARAAVRTWCFQHHTDISGWSFLAFLLGFEDDVTSVAKSSSATFMEVLDLVSSLRLANESVWVFLRTLAASGAVSDEEYARFLAVQGAVLEGSTVPADQAVLRAAVDWSGKYRRPVEA